MLTLRKAADRGQAEHGWLRSAHSFSFGDYFDPKHLGFRQLRVINEDHIAAQKGFGTHPHSDMEIITYILSGALEHKDSMGTGSIIRPGDVQRMTAGTGVTHSEANPSATQPVHLLQIWIVPEKKGLKPSYEQKSFSDAEKRGKLLLVVSREGQGGSVTVHQDMKLYCSLLTKGESVTFESTQQRHAWVQVARGNLRLNELELGAGDGVAVAGHELLRLTAVNSSEILLFDLA